MIRLDLGSSNTLMREMLSMQRIRWMEQTSWGLECLHVLQEEALLEVVAVVVVLVEGDTIEVAREEEEEEEEEGTTQAVMVVAKAITLGGVEATEGVIHEVDTGVLTGEDMGVVEVVIHEVVAVTPEAVAAIPEEAAAIPEEAAAIPEEAAAIEDFPVEATVVPATTIIMRIHLTEDVAALLTPATRKQGSLEHSPTSML